MKKYLINFFIQKGVGFSPSLMFADFCSGIQLYIPNMVTNLTVSSHIIYGIKLGFYLIS